MNSVDVRAKLKELGLELPVAALPIAAYVPAIRTGNIVFTANFQATHRSKALLQDPTMRLAASPNF